MLSLWLSVVVTLSAPSLAYLLTLHPRLHKYFDRLVSFGLLILLVGDLIPDAVRHTGEWTLLSLAVGLMLPLVLGRYKAEDNVRLQQLMLWVGFSAFLGHALLDGFALNMAQHEHHGHTHDSLALGVLLHRLPVALSLWWLLSQRLGTRSGLLGLITLSLATLLGGLGGAGWFDEPSPAHFGHFQALMSGLLLHVLFHQPHHSRRAPAHLVDKVE